MLWNKILVYPSLKNTFSYRTPQVAASVSRVDQKKIKYSWKAYTSWKCFKFWRMIIILRKLYANKAWLPSGFNSS